MNYYDLPRTLGALKHSSFAGRLAQDFTVKDELRANLICRLETGQTLFPGITGYEDTVVPQVVNAILSRHNFILLGLRGQAKTRLARLLTGLLDAWMPFFSSPVAEDSRPCVPAHLQTLPGADRRAAGRDADRVGESRGSLCREAGDPGCHDCRHDRRHRSTSRQPGTGQAILGA